MRYIIASDFHLKYRENEDDVRRRRCVESFLNGLCGQIDGLILAGDVFDLWVEWEKVIIKNYFHLLRIFAQMKDAGTRLIYIAGNHDFWLGDFLSDTIGFEIYKDYFVETICGKRVFVSHGDLFTHNDTRYRIFRKIVRTRTIQYIYKLFHPDFSLSVGQALSRTSRDRKDTTESFKRKEAGFYTKAAELSKEYDLIVFGHSHNPQKIDIETSVYINLGDWIVHNTYCEIDDNGVALRNYEL